jgi:uncharacterized protein
MGKYLLLALLAVVVYFFWRGFHRASRPPRDRGGGAGGERMVDCSQCGVHLPLSDAVGEDGRYFCSEEHRRLYRR